MARASDRQPEPQVQPRAQRLQSATRVLAVLTALADHPDGATPKAIAAELGLHLSTTYHLLNTLIAAGYATRGADTRLFRLGPRVPLIHEAFVMGIRPSPTASGLARALREATGETVHLCRLLGDDLVTADIVEGSGADRISGSRVGMGIVAHAVAAGRVLLAWQPEPQIAVYLSRSDLFARVAHLKPNQPQALGAELRRIRKMGYALDRAEGHPDFACIAAPLPCADGQVDEAIALLVPRGRFERDEVGLIRALLAITKMAVEVRESGLAARANPGDRPAEQALAAALREAIDTAHHTYLDAAYPRLG